MPQFGGKNAKKIQKTSSDSKRHFTVVMGNKEHGLYVSSTPSSAAKKAVTKLCASDKGEKVEFSLREITQDSNKKTYGPYIGYIEKLANPIQLKGRVIENMPVVYLKKREMKGGDGINDIQPSLGNCGKKNLFSIKNPLKECIVLSYKNRKITLDYVRQNIIQVKYFNNINSSIYNSKIKLLINTNTL